MSGKMTKGDLLRQVDERNSAAGKTVLAEDFEAWAKKNKRRSCSDRDRADWAAEEASGVLIIKCSF